MKSLATTMWLSVIGIASAQAAPSVCSSVFCLHAAPAPSIGAGVPVALAIGGDIVRHEAVEDLAAIVS